MRARVNRPTFFDDDGREEKALPAAVASLSLDLLLLFFSRSLPPSSPPALPLLPPPARSALSINKKPFGFQLLKKTSKTSKKKPQNNKNPKGPMLLMDQGYKAEGEVFTVPVLHKRITFLLGPHASPHFFKANDDEMSQKEVYEFNVPTFGPGVVFDVDHKTRAEQFRFFADALKSARLALYVPQFVSEAREYFAGWGDEGVVDLKDALAELTVMTAARTLLGEFFSFFLNCGFFFLEGEKTAAAAQNDVCFP